MVNDKSSNGTSDYQPNNEAQFITYDIPKEYNVQPLQLPSL